MRSSTRYLQTSAALAMIVCFAAPVASQPPRAELSVEMGSAKGGGVAAVPIRLISSIGIRAVQFEIVYDPTVFLFKRVNPESSAPVRVGEVNLVQPGRVRLALTSEQEIRGVDRLLTAEFEVIEGPPTTTSISLEEVRAWIQENGEPVEVASRPNEWKRIEVSGRGSSEGGLAVGYGLVGVIVLVAVILALLHRRSLEMVEKER